MVKRTDPADVPRSLTYVCVLIVVFHATILPNIEHE
jgi:hypothetical protein